MPQTVSEMLNELEAGVMSVEQAAAWVREHKWPPARSTPPPRNAAEAAVLQARTLSRL